MDWLALVVAGIFEIIWAIQLKNTEGFTKLVPSIYTVSAMIVSFFFLSYALRTLPIGTSYAIWTAVGATGTILYGMYYLGESRDPIRIAALFAIIVSIVVLKMTHK
jgi:quaternary ammonium compound-resistance protein SugE